MTILQLISSGGFFGAENVLVQLAEALHKTDSTLRIIAGVIENQYNPHVEVADKCQEKGIAAAIFPCRGRFDFKTISHLRKFISRQGVNVIHSHGYKSNLFSYIASLGFKTARIATCHNWLGDDVKMKTYASLDRFFLRRFDKVIAVSPEVRNKITASGIAARKVAIIQNGIDIERFQARSVQHKIREEFGIPENNLVIGTVSRISKEKGHQYLFETAEDIVKEFPNTTFLVVGDGPLRAELQQQYHSPAIIFTGLRSDLPELYKSMDIFVLPSLTEGLPLVLLEAMASGLPVVASKVGYIPEVILEGQTGFLAEPGNSADLKKNLLELLRSPEKAKLMGKKGYERARDLYSSAQMAKKYLASYQEIAR